VSGAKLPSSLLEGNRDTEKERLLIAFDFYGDESSPSFEVASVEGDLREKRKSLPLQPMGTLQGPGVPFYGKGSDVAEFIDELLKRPVGNFFETAFGAEHCRMLLQRYQHVEPAVSLGETFAPGLQVGFPPGPAFQEGLVSGIYRK
jgi:hypothetical protein